MNVHFLFIALHTIAGVVAFVTGWLAIAQLERKPASGILWTYLGSLVGLVIFMLGAIFVDWAQLATTQRFVYLGLFLLGVYMLVRAYQAFAIQSRQERDWEISFVDHVGFTLISLFDGFVIVSSIDLGVPVWGVVIIGVLGVAAGIYEINRTKSNIASQA